jgi:alkanesulfonate monooxygenase SsuD/methylene tetrahydromethanopterin reductase-like flavin-dependent oxidoreductase (luciferase family)
MRLGVFTSMGSDWKASVEKVRIAEELGFEAVFVPEGWGASAIPFLTAIALNTSRITISPSILNCFSRTPGALAQEFSALDTLSDGRMMLGLGVSGEFVIEHFHGLPFEKPLRRLREYVEVFNILMSGERLQYDGEIFHMSRGFRLDSERRRDHIPVYIAAITPRSIRQTGEIADGIMPIHWPKHLFGQLKEQLIESARAAGRLDPDITIAAQTRVAVLDGKNDEEQWRAARQPLFHYVNRMGKFYWQMLERNGFAEEVGASRAAWERRDAEGAFTAISDDMVRAIQVIGPLEEVREQLHERSYLGADLQVVHMPPGDPEDARRWLEDIIER